jgi:hypothetical protein
MGNRLAILALLVVTAMTEAWSQDAFVQQRRELAHRQRRIILNNDGCDVLYYPKNVPVTVENALLQRTSPLVGSQVDTIFYCPISSGFSNFTYNTKVGTVLDRQVLDGYNATRDLINLGTDALKMVVDFGKQHKIEVFCSMRMNDTHDAAHSPDNPYPLFPPLKYQHPEWLIGSYDNKSQFGPWSGVDYTHPEIRDLAFRYLEEICTNYDVDGIELDFLRHCSYFKSVAYGGTASQAELDMMTDLVRRVRVMADEQGRKRGRPILIAVRVPDSVDYARAVGLDIERWLQEGYVDLLSGTCYYQLNPWEYLVNLGHKYGVPVYPSLSESRVRAKTPVYSRTSQQTYRARAAEVWQAGADGIYLFNFFNPKAPMLSEIGDPKALATMDKTYFVTVRNYRPSMYLKDGERFQNVPILTPDNPWALSAGKPITVPIELGKEGEGATVSLCLMTTAPTGPQVSVNGTDLAAPTRKDPWWEYPVPATILKPGHNEVTLKATSVPSDSDLWDVIWQGDQKPPTPWSAETLGKNRVAEAKDGALLVADRGVNSGEYLYFVYPWNADPARETVAEVQAKVISGINSIIFSNGVAGDRVILTPGEISWYSTRQKYAMNTTDDFHTYRLVLKGQDMSLQVDGKTVLDAPGKFTVPIAAGRNTFQFGASNSPQVGEALWKSAKLRSGVYSVLDVAMKFDYPS